MYKKLQTKFLALLAIMLMGGSSAWAETGTLNFGNGEGDVKINGESVTGSDDHGNTWTITTVGTTSFTASTAYYQVGSSSKPATSITFTTTLPNNVNVTSLSAKFGGFNGTAGTVTLKVGDTTVGTGSLNGSNDVTVSSTSEELGNVLTITLTDIAKGVKCYYVSYTYSVEPHTVTLSDDNTTLTETSGGAGVTLPARDDLGNYTFAGWSVTNVADETTTAPTIVAAGMYHPTADVTLYPVYTRTEGSATTETATVSISDYATNNSWVDASQYTTVDIDDNVTATASGGGNTGKYYTNGQDWRFYQNEDAMVSIALTPNGTLNSVKFDFTVSKSGTLNYGGNVVESGTVVNVSGNTAEFTVGNSGTATNGQVRITDIEVNYTIGNGTTYYWSNPGATVSISSVGLATFCSQYALDFSGVTEVWAYIAKYEKGKVTYHRVKKVPANTGLLLRNPNGGATSQEVQVPVLTGAADDVEGNKFIGRLTEISSLPSIDGNNTNYILNNGDNGVGFYKANGKKVGAGKAYLQLPTEGAKTFIGFDEEGEATAISTIDNGQLTMDNAYNLQGQKVGSEYKGIVIVNGKKFINK